MAGCLRTNHGSCEGKGQETGALEPPSACLTASEKEGPISSRIRVIGTAGHVDHGKSSLIEALTGTHPDRLKEEKAREMTIELGFGWLTLPDGREVGIVDVPGHRDFVENMLAGVAGIDAALLVVAADEGVMPQTREHLAILDLLQIPGGVIALTKIDLDLDDGWMGEIEQDVRSAAAGTILQDAPIMRVSAKTGVGLDELVAVLAGHLNQRPDRPDLGRPRLPLDRVFTMEGFGTVVTGTLTDGELRLGDEVEILPSGRRGRIRGLQTHRRAVERALPGSRTAVNVSGIAADHLSRGEVLIHPGQYAATRRLDARLRLLPDASSQVTHQLQVKVFVGTSESVATLRLLGTDAIGPGQKGWIQLDLQHPIVCARGDAFVLRRPSPPETLGGGTIVDSQPAGRHRRFDAEVIASLESLAEGQPADVLFEAALALGTAPIRAIVQRSHLTPERASAGLAQLLREGRLIPLEGGALSVHSDALAMNERDWQELRGRLSELLAAYHVRFPLKVGIPREELKSQLRLSAKAFHGVIARCAAQAILVERGQLLASPQHEVRFDRQQASAVASLMRVLAESRFSPPSVKECRAALGEELFGALRDAGRIVQVSDDVVFRDTEYAEMVATVRSMLHLNGQVTLAQVRDGFTTSRKYAQALLEHLDAIGVTRREGDARVAANQVNGPHGR